MTLLLLIYTHIPYLFSRTEKSINTFCPRIHFHIKGTLVCIGQNNSIVCFNITNELPNLSVILNSASFSLPCLSPILFRAVYSCDKYTNENIWPLSSLPQEKRESGRAPAHCFISHIERPELVIWS